MSVFDSPRRRWLMLSWFGLDDGVVIASDKIIHDDDVLFIPLCLIVCLGISLFLAKNVSLSYSDHNKRRRVS